MNDRQLAEALRTISQRPSSGFEEGLLQRLEAERDLNEKQWGSRKRIIVPFGILAVGSVCLARLITGTETIRTLAEVYPVADELPALVIGLNGLLLCVILWYGRTAKRMAQWPFRN